MKRIINLFRDINNQKKGWLGIKGHYFALDKQKHVVIGLLVFFISLMFTISDNALGIVFTVAIAKEINDHFGILKFLLVNSKKTAINVFDIVATVFIPVIIQLVILYV